MNTTHPIVMLDTVIPPSPNLMNISSMAWMEPDKSLAHPSLFPTKHNMVWGASLSEFIFNRICELVKRGVNCRHGFKEHHLQSVCNGLLDFIGVSVSPSQLYNHARKWKKSGQQCASLRIFQGCHFVAKALPS
jgi:hypothetical protein